MCIFYFENGNKCFKFSPTEKSPVQAPESKPAPKTIAFSGSGYSLGAAKTSDLEAMEVDQDEGGVIQTVRIFICFSLW